MNRACLSWIRIRRESRFWGASLLVLVLLPHAGAAPPSPNSTRPKGVITESANEISTQIEVLDEQRSELRGYGALAPALQRWDETWDWVDGKIGLRMGFAYTALYQVASDALPGTPRSGASGDLDIFGRWGILPERTGSWLNSGTFGFNLEMRHQIGSATPAELGASTGSLWNTTTGFNEQDLALTEWWWQQGFLDHKLEVRLGKIDLSLLFDAYRFNSSNFFFLNQAFADNPTIPFPENGLGGVVAFYPDDHWFLLLGTGDAEGRKTEIESKPEDVSAWFSAATLGWRGGVGKLGEGLYQLTVWHSDRQSGSQRPSATGFSLVAQQELDAGWVAYARYAMANEAATNTRQLVTAGLVSESPFGRGGDRFGMSLGWGAPHDRKLRSQWVAEMFYRLEPLGELQVSPNVQLVVNPSRNPQSDLIALFGIRGRLNF